MFDAEDRQDMLEAVGVLAELTDADGEFWVKPPLLPDAQQAFAGEMIESINPFCIADVEDIERLGITSGESGSLITLVGHDYRALSIEPENSGFVAIELGAV